MKSSRRGDSAEFSRENRLRQRHDLAPEIVGLHLIVHVPSFRKSWQLCLGKDKPAENSICWL